MAPEVISGEGESSGEIDYWSLGVVLFIVYSKKNPFDGETIEDTLDNIMEYKISWEVLENSKIDPNLLDLIKKFLAYKPEERLKDFQTIKKHPYFKGIVLALILDFNWDECTKFSSPLKDYTLKKLKLLNEKLKTNKIANNELTTLEKRRSSIQANKSLLRKSYYIKRENVLNESNTSHLKRIMKRKSVSESFMFNDHSDQQSDFRSEV